MAITLPGGTIGDEVIEQVREAFGSAHETQYGHRTEDPVEIVTIRVRGSGLVPRPELPKLARGDGSAPTPRTNRGVWRGGESGRVDYAVYERDSLMPGSGFDGPAVSTRVNSATCSPPCLAVSFWT